MMECDILLSIGWTVLLLGLGIFVMGVGAFLVTYAIDWETRKMIRQMWNDFWEAKKNRG